MRLLERRKKREEEQEGKKEGEPGVTVRFDNSTTDESVALRDVVQYPFRLARSRLLFVSCFLSRSPSMQCLGEPKGCHHVLLRVDNCRLAHP
mmetsp:Transcript_37089/g.89446  ORF Transcript_37089/g.89446 Transcript_37089/m.89446 type:complete len:92 (+) Transcript_37089:81-356(+)